MGTELSGKCFGLKKKKETPKQNSYGTNTRKFSYVKSSYCEESKVSARRHSAALGLSDRSVRRILHKDLNFHPYKIAIFDISVTVHHIYK